MKDRATGHQQQIHNQPAEGRAENDSVSIQTKLIFGINMEIAAHTI